MKRLIIIGTSTTAATILQFVQHYKLFNVIGFAVNKSYLTADEYCGLPVYPIEELDTIINKENDRIFVAMQWNKLNAERRSVYERLKCEGWHFANLVSPHAVVNGLLVGDNCWIADNAIIDFGATIGNDVFVKIAAFVADNTTVHDHCFIGAKSTIGGGCTIGEQTFVGLNSTIFDCTTIGRKCLVGACSIVKRNLPDFTRCKTSSDTCEIKQFGEDEIESKLMFKKNVRTLTSTLEGGVIQTSTKNNRRAA